MSRARVQLGQLGEDLAARKLSQEGYDIVDRNWRCKDGEIDIVAQRSGVWIFFEVRTCRGRGFGAPEESVSAAKQQRMCDLAVAYLVDHDKGDPDWQIGFVAVEMDASGRLMRVEVYDCFI